VNHLAFERTLLSPGQSCWKTAVASRISMIQDAALAFNVIAEAMEAARRTIFIVGWDIDSRTVLRPEAAQPEASRLLPLLCSCLERQPALEVFILIWDFSIIYATSPSVRTYPARLPLFAFDRIWVSPPRAVTALSALGGRDTWNASDHRVVVATLRPRDTATKAELEKAEGAGVCGARRRVHAEDLTGFSPPGAALACELLARCPARGLLRLGVQ
jgi:hypothetical protein